MDENEKWTNEVKNNENLIDGLDNCELVDDSENRNNANKDGKIDIEYIEEISDISFVDNGDDELNIEEADYIQDNDEIEKEFVQDNNEVEETQDIVDSDDDDDYKYIIKPQNIVSEPQEEFTEEQIKKREILNEQHKWANEMAPSVDLDSFPIEKNKDIQDLDEDDDCKDSDSNIEIETMKEEYTVDITKIPLEVAVGKEEIDIVKPKDFRELVDVKGKKLENYISGDSKFSSISETLDVCIELCKLFASVHEMGYCFNGVTGDDIVITKNKKCKLINDKKIVSVDDDTYQVNYEKTCAPEVLKNQCRPNMNTDKHSMAFLLFGLLFKSDPFEGSKVLNTPCYNVQDELESYKEPVFVYSNKDKSNMPVYGIHSILIKYWNRFYPYDIKMLFNQMFVEGIESSEARAEDKTCIEKLMQFKNIVDSKNINKESDKNKKEPAAKESLLDKLKHNKKIEIIDNKDFEQKEKTIEINKDAPKKTIDESLPKYILYASYVLNGGSLQNRETEEIILTPGTEIENRFVGYEELENTKIVIGKVIENSKHKGVLGIRNMSNHEWIAYKGNSSKKFPSGKVLVVSDRVEIDFYPENQSKSKTQWYIHQV